MGILKTVITKDEPLFTVRKLEEEEYKNLLKPHEQTLLRAICYHTRDDLLEAAHILVTIAVKWNKPLIKILGAWYQAYVAPTEELIGG